MASPETKERLLDAAERLFAARGFHHTSLRELTAAAGVNLAAVNYHFGTKFSLLRAVFERRLVPLNRRRTERLNDIRAMARDEGRPPEVREVLAAFISPVIALSRGPGEGARSFTALAGRTLAESDDAVRGLFMEYLRPGLHLCFDRLCEALPSHPRDVVFWRLILSLGAMARLAAPAGHGPFVPEGIGMPGRAEELTDLLLPFITAGMEAPSP